MQKRRDQLAPSAGDHQWTEILVRIYPRRDNATITVHHRCRRGADVEWDRRLGFANFSFDPLPSRDPNRIIVLNAARALLELYDRMPRSAGPARGAASPATKGSAPLAGATGSIQATSGVQGLEVSEVPAMDPLQMHLPLGLPLDR